MKYRRLRPDGYVDLWVPGHPVARRDGYAFEHRIVAFDAGLLTDLSLHVHHINHDKSDNRPANLAVLTVEEHARHHAAEDGHIANQYGLWPLRGPRRERSVRPCTGCADLIPLTRRVDALYCTNNCRVRTFKRNARRDQRRQVAA